MENSSKTSEINLVFTELLKEYQTYVVNESKAIRFLILTKVFLVIFLICYYIFGKKMLNIDNLIEYVFLFFALVYGVCVFYYLKGAKHWRKIKRTLKETAKRYNIDNKQLTKDFNSIAPKTFGGRGIAP